MTDMSAALSPVVTPREPRPHQVVALTRLRASLRSGKRRPCLCLPTGGGKTFIAAHLARGAVAQGGCVVFTVPALSLIDQTVAAFEAEGLPHVGVIQADHPRTDPAAPVQVASIQTLSRRSLPAATLVLVDEAHRDAAIIRRWMREAPGTYFIGLTATPGRPGMDREYDDLVLGPTTREMIEASALSPVRTFAAAHPDLRGVRTVAGDYHEGELARVMSQGGMVADVVSTWLAKAEARPTLVFAVDRAHARKLQADFEAAGVPCGYIDGDSTVAERRDVAGRFQRGELPVICNVGCLTTGVDWDVRCVVLARPTKSEMLYVQMVGRGLRTAPGKQDCLVLDHSDTTLRLGLVTDIVFGELPKRGKNSAKDGRKGRSTPLPRECPKCSFIRAATVFACPSCGHAPIEVVQGSLREVSSSIGARPKPWRVPLVERQRWFSELLHIAATTGRKRGWAAHAFKERFGVWPDGLSEIRKPATPEVRAWARQRSTSFLRTIGRAG